MSDENAPQPHPRQRTQPLSGIRPPSPLSTAPKHIKDNWKLFKQRWNNYQILTALDQQTREYQVALFLHTIGDDGLKIYNGLQFAQPEEERTVDHIIAAFDSFAIGEINETYERFVFNSRVQNESESFDVFLTAIRQLVTSCNYCDNCVDSIVRDRIILGVSDSNTQTALLRERNLTLTKTIDTCRAAENASVQHKAFSQPQDSVNKLQQKKRYKTSSSAENPDNRVCKYCDRSHPMLKSRCPAYGKTCSYCQQENHFAVKCPKKKKKRVHNLRDDVSERSFVSESSGDEYIDALTSTGNRKDVKCRMLMPDKTEIIFQVDTGSSVNVLPAKYQPPNMPLNPVKKTLFAWNEGKVTALGTCRHSMRNPLNNRKYNIEFVIVKENFTPILGLRASQAMSFITLHDDEFDRVSAISLDNHKEVFNKTVGNLPGVHTLNVDTSIKPVVMPDRRIPLSVRPKLKAELDKLVVLGVLTPVDEPTPWVSQLVITLKKSGALRVCIDPKCLNKALQRERYTLPTLPHHYRLPLFIL